MLATFLLASVLVSFGQLGWPGLHWDAALYGTPVINVASGKGWFFGSYAPALLSRPDNSYSIHGLLHVIVYGGILKAKTWSNYMFALGLVNALTFAVYTAIYSILLCRIERPGFKPLLSSVLIGSIPAVICLGLQGRPEQLAPLIMSIPVLTSLITSRTIARLTALGVCLALLTVLSPLVGIIFFTFLLGYLYVLDRGRFSTFVRDAASCGLLAACLVGALISIATPIQPLEWLLNIYSGGNSGAHPGFEGILLVPFSRRWGHTFTAPAWNLAILFFLAYGFLRIWQTKGFRLLIFALLIPVAIYINRYGTDYSYMPFLPLAIAFSIEGRTSPWRAELSGPWRTGSFQIGLLALASLYFYVLVSYLAISLTAPYQEVSLAAARQAFHETPAWQELRTEPIAIGFPTTKQPSLVFLGDADQRFASFHLTNPSDPAGNDLTNYERRTGLRVRYYLLPQELPLQQSTPPESITIGVHQFTLQQSNWTGSRHELADQLSRPRSLSNRYNYALYRRSTN